MRLQTARKGRNESPQQFANRCRALYPKIVCKADQPLIQRVYYENADRLLLASFVAGLTAVPGRQRRFVNPQTLDQALKIALSVQEAEKQEKFNESFCASFNNSSRQHSPSSSRRASHQCYGSCNAEYTVNQSQRQRNMVSCNERKSKAAGTRSSQTKAAPRCYECEGFGHFARECPTRHKREIGFTNSPGKRNPSELSRRSHSPSKRLAPRTKSKCGRKTVNQGNAREA
jgi:hypothetical protein